MPLDSLILNARTHAQTRSSVPSGTIGKQLPLGVFCAWLLVELRWLLDCVPEDVVDETSDDCETPQLELASDDAPQQLLKFELASDSAVGIGGSDLRRRSSRTTRRSCDCTIPRSVGASE